MEKSILAQKCVYETLHRIEFMENSPFEITVIIRVYNRMEDLHHCLSLIRTYWKQANYRIIVVSNGKERGYTVPAETASLADTVIELETNAGHIDGNSQLVQAGLEQVPVSSDFTIIIEADTWILDDSIIMRYCRKLIQKKAVWASAQWIEKYHSLALDFAIFRSELSTQHPQLFQFVDAAECGVCSELRRLKLRYILIDECMPVHIPSFARRWYNPFGGRERIFVRAKMVTHHVEDLPGGMNEKLAAAEIAAGTALFGIADHRELIARIKRQKRIDLLVRISPRSRWIRPTRDRFRR